MLASLMTERNESLYVEKGSPVELDLCPFAGPTLESRLLRALLARAYLDEQLASFGTQLGKSRMDQDFLVAGDTSFLIRGYDEYLALLREDDPHDGDANV